MLAHAAETIGHYAIRKRGTIGGSLAHADPAAQLPLVALALDAEMEIHSARGIRMVPARDFFLSIFTTILDPDELLVAIHVPLSPPQEGWGFRLFNRRAGDFAIVSVAATLARGADGAVAGLRLAIGGIGPVPVRAEQLVAGDLAKSLSSRVEGLARARRRRGRRRRRDRGQRADPGCVSQGAGRGADAGGPRSGAGADCGACIVSEFDPVPIVLTINGTQYRLFAEPRRLLSDVLRDDCGLTGTHVGCEHGVCGACTILLDGAPARACLTYAVQVQGHEITTIEAFGGDGRLVAGAAGAA